MRALRTPPSPGTHCAAIRFSLKIFLNRSQHFAGTVAEEMVQLPRKWAGLDEYHVVIVSQCGSLRAPRKGHPRLTTGHTNAEYGV